MRPWQDSSGREIAFTSWCKELPTARGVGYWRAIIAAPKWHEWRVVGTLAERVQSCSSPGCQNAGPTQLENAVVSLKSPDLKCQPLSRCSWLPTQVFWPYSALAGRALILPRCLHGQVQRKMPHSSHHRVCVVPGDQILSASAEVTKS